MAAVGAAIAGGYGIELDIQVSGDGHAMVFHDTELERLTDSTGAVRNHSGAELETFRLQASGETIPSLASVLGEVRGQVPLLLDVKNKSLRVGRYEAAVHRDLVDYQGQVAVLVWNPWSMAWFRRHAPGLPIGHIVTVLRYGGYWKPWYLNAALRRLRAAPFRRPDFVAWNVDLLPNPLARRARREGTPILTWAVRDAGQRAVAGAEADNIIFEGYRP